MLSIDLDRYRRLGLGDVAEKCLAGERLTLDDGARLFACPDVTAVGALAHHERLRRHGSATTYVVNRHVNYTNVCVNGCSFCAYSRARPDQEGAFVLSRADILERVAATPENVREIHIVGGCHPDLPLAFFEDALAAARDLRPSAALKCFTAVEIAHFARLEGISEAEVLTRLRAAGLAMLPGGGAEIFAEPVRERICPGKLGSSDWLAVHRTAHTLGLTTNCTMLYGHVETPADRLDHLDRLRRLQDETNGFTCFIPLAFQTGNNQLAAEATGREAGGLDHLRTMAVSRLMLDNIPHLKAYWVMLGVKTAQAALFFGADDLDGTVVEEKIGRMAGAHDGLAMSREELETMIADMGLMPVERDALFRPVEQMRGEAAAC